MRNLDHTTVADLKRALKLAPDAMQLKVYVGDRKATKLDYKVSILKNEVKLYITVDEGHPVTDQLNAELATPSPIEPKKK